MKLDLNFQLKDLSGTLVEEKDFCPARVVANILALRTDKIEPAKAYSYSVKLWDTGVLEDVSVEDIDEIIQLVNICAKQGGITNLACGRIVDFMEQAKSNVS